MIDLYETTRTRYARQLFIRKVFSLEFTLTDSVFLSFFLCFFHMEGNGSGYGRKLRNARIRSIFLSSFFLPPRLWNFMTLEDVQAFTTLRQIIAWSLMG